MVRKINYSDEFVAVTDDLIRTLYTQNYFGFVADAQDYVDRIYDFVRDNIRTYPAKTTPDELKEYGEKYILYKVNSRTTWYIFFNLKEDAYYVEYIANNHTHFIANFNL
jgi:hypothetical protein